MSARAVVFPVYSFRDYLRFEQDSPTKHEFFAGQIYGMAGGTPDHAALAMAVALSLGTAPTERRCRLYSSDLRVRAAGLVTYPDVSVVCGRPKHDPEDANTLINPTLVVEVMSKSTEKYDRGGKFEQYKQIPSLQEYVLVSQREQAIEVRRRTRSGWTSRVAGPGEQVVLRSMGVTLDVDAIYRATGAAPKRARKPQSADHRRSSRKGTARRRSR